MRHGIGAETLPTPVSFYMLPWFRTHSRWRKFILYWIPALYLAWVILGFFAIGPITKHWVLPRLAKRLNGTLTVERISFNPFTWRMVFDKLEIKDAQGERTIAFNQIDANAEPWRTVFRSGWHLSELHLREPYINGVINPDASINLLNLIKPSAEASKPLTELPRIVIDQFRVDTGEVYLTDATPPAPLTPVQLKWTGLSFALDDIDTRPEKQNDHTATARTADGETITWTGNFFADPITSTGTIELKDFKLNRFDSYVQQLTTCTLQRGTVSLKVSYDFAPTRTPRRAAFIVDSLTLTDLAVTQGNGELLDIQRLELTDLITNAGRQTLRVKSVNITGGHALAHRHADGTINLLQIPRTNAKLAITPPASATLKRALTSPDGKPYPLEQLADAIEKLITDVQGPWTLALDKITTKDFTLKLRDETPRKPVELTLSAIDLTAGPIKTEDKYATTVKVDCKIAEGSLAADGTIKPLSLAAELDAKFSNLDAAPLGSYIPLLESASFPRPHIESAVLSGAGKLRVSPELLQWTGLVDGQLECVGEQETNLRLHANFIEGKAEVQMSAPITASYDGRVWVSKIQGRLLSNSSPFQFDAEGCRLTGNFQLTETGTLAAERLFLGVSGKFANLTFGPVAGAFGNGGGSLRGDAKLSPNGDISASLEANAAFEIRATDIATLGPFDFSMNGFTAAGTLAHQAGQATTVACSVKYQGIRGEATDFLGRTTAAASEGNFSMRFERVSNQPSASMDGDLGTVVLSAKNIGDATLAIADVKTTKLAFNSAQRTISAKSISLTQPEGSILIAFLPPLPDAKPVAKVPTLTAADLRHIRPIIEKLSEYKLALGALDVTSAKLSVTDPTTTPATALVLSDASASLRGFTSDSKSPLTFTADTKVNTSGRVKVAGDLDLTGSTARGAFTIDMGAIPTPPYSPVSSRYLGYTNPEGRLTAKIPVKIENDFVRGTLDANLDRFFLGESVDSRQAISLPVKLGLALLRDRNDQIKLSIPFEGRLHDPDFSWGGLVWQAVFNVLSKAATAPFQLLAMALGGGSGDDLSTIEFDAGASELSPEMLARLDKLSTALTDRPALSLRLLPAVDAEADTAALKLAQLKRTLQGKDAQAPLPAEYAKRLQSTYERLNIRPEPKSPPTNEQMERALTETIKLPDDALTKLAAARAQSVIELLVNEKKLDAKRVTIADDKDAKNKPTGAKVALELY